jgi:DNA-binding NarL/FixJ family response regulator
MLYEGLVDEKGGVIQMPSRESKVYPPMISRRERSILYLIAEGYENREIADELYISEKTVRGTQTNLMRKWNAPDVSSVINHAVEKGLISIYEVLESRFSKRKSKTI